MNGLVTLRLEIRSQGEVLDAVESNVQLRYAAREMRRFLDGILPSGDSPPSEKSVVTDKRTIWDGVTLPDGEYTVRNGMLVRHVDEGC